MIQRGQIWHYVVGSRRVQVLIVSDAENYPEIMPWALIVRRDAPRPNTGLVVSLGYSDRMDGSVVDIPAVLRVDPSGLRENLGFISDDTMNEVEAALRRFLSVP